MADDDIMRPMAADLKKTREDAKKRYDDSEEHVKSLESKRKWFGGSKKHGGFAGMGATDDMIEDAKKSRDRAHKEHRMWEDQGAELPKRDKPKDDENDIFRERKGRVLYDNPRSPKKDK